MLASFTFSWYFFSEFTLHSPWGTMLQAPASFLSLWDRLRQQQSSKHHLLRKEVTSQKWRPKARKWLVRSHRASEAKQDSRSPNFQASTLSTSWHLCKWLKSGSGIIYLPLYSRLMLKLSDENVFQKLNQVFKYHIRVTCFHNKSRILLVALLQKCLPQTCLWEGAVYPSLLKPHFQKIKLAFPCMQKKTSN